MSRELEFRVWDDVIHDWHATKALVNFNDRCNKGYNFNIVCFGNPKRTVIEQYTGLKDKNGKEIYEGDIVKDTSDGDCLINEVFWCEKGGFWGVKPNNPFTDREWGWFIDRENIEVIGNIHENPELVGGEDE